MPGLAEQLDPKQPLFRLAEAIKWEGFEKAYEDFYSKEGRPAKPVRLMVGLLLLKQLENLSDEVVCDGGRRTLTISSSAECVSSSGRCLVIPRTWSTSANGSAMRG